MEIIQIKSKAARIKRVQKIIESTGNHIGSVWFNKRSDNSLRKMSFRLYAQNPTYAPKPTEKGITERKKHDADNLQITVLDVNKVLRARSGRRKGKISGRAMWRTIPLDCVKRICVNGVKYKILDFIST